MKRRTPHILALGLALVLSQQPFASGDGPGRDVKASKAGPITLSLVDSDIRDALRMVAMQAGVNIVMSKSVEGTISLELKDVSLSESLDAIVTVGGFQYEIEQGIVTVSTLGERREKEQLLRDLAPAAAGPEQPDVLLLNLRYVDAERIKPVVEKLLSEAGTVSLLETSDHLNNEYRDVAPTLDDGQGLALSSNLSTSSQGRPAQSHTLVVMDLPTNLNRIKRIVAGIDVMPMSILIETRFVEIRLDDENRLGIDWNVLAGLTGSMTPTTFPFGDSSLGSFDPNVVGGSPGGVFPPAPNSVTIPGTDGLFTFGSLDFTAFTAVLEMIQRNSRVQVVSNPRIVVNDRHTATILVGERYPILSANISEFGTVIEQLDRYEPVGVQLVVTPSILGDDEVELFVRPTTSSIGSLVEGSSGLQVARINSRQIDTAVTVKDGQTAVLGGLITTREAEITNTVPFLGAIPLLGQLFSHESTQSERVDLVVFLTVRIIREPGLTEAQRMLFEETSFDVDGGVVQGRARSELEYSESVARF